MIDHRDTGEYYYNPKDSKPTKEARKWRCAACGVLMGIPKLPRSQPYCSVQCRDSFRWRLEYSERSVYHLLERDGFRCGYCGRHAMDEGVKLHLDHMIPKSKGGPDTADNLLTSCSDCNLAKSDKPLPPTLLSELQAKVAERNAKAGIQTAASIKGLRPVGEDVGTDTFDASGPGSPASESERCFPRIEAVCPKMSQDEAYEWFFGH